MSFIESHPCEKDLLTRTRGSPIPLSFTDREHRSQRGMVATLVNSAHTPRSHSAPHYRLLETYSSSRTGPFMSLAHPELLLVGPVIALRGSETPATALCVSESQIGRCGAKPPKLAVLGSYGSLECSNV